MIDFNAQTPRRRTKSASNQNRLCAEKRRGSESGRCHTAANLPSSRSYGLSSYLLCLSCLAGALGVDTYTTAVYMGGRQGGINLVTAGTIIIIHFLWTLVIAGTATRLSYYTFPLYNVHGNPLLLFHPIHTHGFSRVRD